VKLIKIALSAVGHARRIIFQSSDLPVEELRCFEWDGTQTGKEPRWLTWILASITLPLPAPVPLLGLGKFSMKGYRIR